MLPALLGPAADLGGEGADKIALEVSTFARWRQSESSLWSSSCREDFRPRAALGSSVESQARLIEDRELSPQREVDHDKRDFVGS
jgi:hypothetical protein